MGLDMSKKLLYLHIGRAKTGSSAIQAFLTGNREVLARQGVCYPRTGTRLFSPQQGEISAACHQKSSISEEEISDLKARFDEEVAAFRRIIVSSEGFQNLTKADRLRRFFGKAPRLAKIFSREPYNIKVICYLREFLDSTRSAWAQKIQATGTFCSFAEYCSIFRRVGLEAFIKFWEKFADETEFISYENAREKKSGVVGDFIERLGLDLAPDENPTDSNPTISGNLLVFKLALNRVTSHKREYYAALKRLALSDSRFRGAFYISEDFSNRIRKDHVKYNRDLKAMVGDFPMTFFSDKPFLYDPDRWKSDMERFFAEPEFKGLREIEELRNSDPGSWGIDWK